MIRIDLDDEPLAVLILTPRLIGWTAELRPLYGQPNLGTGRVWRPAKFAAARALLDRLASLDPLSTHIKRRLFAGLTAELDAQILNGNGTGPASPRGILGG